MTCGTLRSGAQAPGKDIRVLPYSAGDGVGAPSSVVLLDVWACPRKL
jgi:hypothetical protein